MLRKLLKYEIKATARLFLPMYATVLIFSVLNKVFSLLKGMSTFNGILENVVKIFSSLTVLIYVVFIIATFALTLIVLIQRFYKNLLGDEGYLMFTLPVKPSTHIISKMLVSAMWSLCSVVVTIFSVAILAFQSIDLRKFFTDLEQTLAYTNSINMSQLLDIFWFAMVYFLISLFMNSLMIYASIAIGSLFYNHRVLYSFAGYLVLYIICQIVTSIALVIEMLLNGVDSIYKFASFSLITSIGLSIALTLGYYFITNYILSKKLNLE